MVAGVGAPLERLGTDGVTCSVEGCGKSVQARGLCFCHYQRWYRHGDPLYLSPRARRAGGRCEATNCDRRVYGHGYCQKHYYHWKRYGDPNYVRERRVCAIDGCTRRHSALGYCSVHYYRFKAHGNPFTVLQPYRGRTLCAVTGCKRPVYADGYCHSHANRVRSYGDPMADVPLGRRSRTVLTVRARREAVVCTYSNEERHLIGSQWRTAAHHTAAAVTKREALIAWQGTDGIFEIPNAVIRAHREQRERDERGGASRERAA